MYSLVIKIDVKMLNIQIINSITRLIFCHTS